MDLTIIVLILFKMMTLIKNLEIIPLESNILPVSLGRAYITKKNLQFIYHIDLNWFEDLILNYQKEIDNFKNSKLGFAQTANYRYLKQTNEINFNTLEEILNENIRIKRGLINIGGKISKILFGTLDSDDEELYKNYFKSIEKNEKVLMRNQKQIALIVNDLKNKYIEKLHRLSDNLKLFQIVPQLEEVEQMHFLTFQLKDVKNALDEIQTAVSFARLHLLHESILPYSKFSKLVENSTIIPLHHIKDYYQLCNTKIIFINKVLLFIISIPLVHKDNFDLHKFYYLPQNNLTLPFTDPYLLSEREILKWSTRQCYQVEEDYLCDQDSLVEPPTCMKKILENHIENCSRKEVFQPPDLKLLEDGNILSMENQKVMEICPQQTKYYFVPSMAILRTRCAVSNGRKDIFPTTTVDEEKYIVLPQMTSSLNKHNGTELPEMENIPDITLEEIDQWNLQPSRFTLVFILSIIIFAIFVFFTLKYFRKNIFIKATPQEGDTFSLGGEELHNPNPIF